MASTKQAMSKLQVEWDGSAYNYFNLITHILSQCNTMLDNRDNHANAIGMCLAPPLRCEECKKNWIRKCFARKWLDIQRRQILHGCCFQKYPTHFTPILLNDASFSCSL